MLQCLGVIVFEITINHIILLQYYYYYYYHHYFTITFDDKEMGETSTV